MTSESKTLILKENSTNICFDKKKVRNYGKGFLLNTKFYNSANDAYLFPPKKCNMEWKVAVHTNGTDIKKQEQTTTKKTGTHKIHANEIHAKLVYPREDRMCVTTKHLNYIVKVMLEVCEDCAMAKSKHKYLNKVAEESYPKLGKIINLDLISQKKPSYGGSNI